MISRMFQVLKQSFHMVYVRLYVLLYGVGVVLTLFVPKETGRVWRQKLFSRFFYYFGAVMLEPRLTEIKEEVYGQMHLQKPVGSSLSVLEIGAGSGPNLRYYPKGTQLSVVDPNPAFLDVLTIGLKKHPEVQLAKHFVCYGEDMSEIPSNSIDAVVTSCVFCSVSDTKTVLKEIRRILVPGGKYYFVEHVLDFKSPLIRLIQKFLLITRIWPTLGCGCHFRDVKSAFEKAAIFGKADIKAKHGYHRENGLWDYLLTPLPLVRPYYYGVATKNVKTQNQCGG